MNTIIIVIVLLFFALIAIIGIFSIANEIQFEKLNEKNFEWFSAGRTIECYDFSVDEETNKFSLIFKAKILYRRGKIILLDDGKNVFEKDLNHILSGIPKTILYEKDTDIVLKEFLAI